MPTPLLSTAYYQWVPFVLGLQSLFFYFPLVAWRMVCNKHFGGDLFSLVKAASHGVTDNIETRDRAVHRIAMCIHDLLTKRRCWHRMVSEI